MKRALHIPLLQLGLGLAGLALAGVLLVVGQAPVYAAEPQEEAAVEQQEAASAQDAGSEAAENSQETTPAQSASSNESSAPAATQEASKPVEVVSLESTQPEVSKEQQEAQNTFEAAQSEAGSAVGMLEGLWSVQAQLMPYFNELEQAWALVVNTDNLRKPLEEELQDCVKQKALLLEQREEVDKQRAEALYNLLVVDEELAHAGGEGLVAVITGTNNATAAESSEYMLAKIARTHAQKKAAAEAVLAKLDAKLEQIETRMNEIHAELDEIEQSRQTAYATLENIVSEGNTVAFSAEKLASEARQTSKEARDKVEALDSKVEGVTEMKSAAQDWDVRSNSLRSSVLDLAGQWYDTVDALVGLEGAISYGCGLDFALSEEDFVAKWGPAIDAFFVSRGAPLAGYGAEMATQAYRYKVDPRLCAAVSIVESSGGQYCIKPHNAWGWGAADSDPYNLASGWASWEEAIESWHRGMATSTTGLGTTPSLTAMGDIYCSTPIWGSKVAALMEQIGSYVVLSEAA